MLSNILFIAFTIASIAFFAWNVNKIRKNILLGKDIDRSDNKGKRWKIMAKVALGQSKMVVRPIAGIMHIIVYVGFILINIEVAEIVIDGVFGTHRFFEPYLGKAYHGLVFTLEWLAFGVLLACVIFLIRRNIIRLKRFWAREMTSWPRSDGNIILIAEIALMIAFLLMNGADSLLMEGKFGGEYGKYAAVGMTSADFPVSQYLAAILPQSADSLFIIERSAWWFHIVGIFLFLNYLPYSKHFHILLAFPNVFYSNLRSKGAFTNMDSVTKEVKLMMDPNADPFAASAEGEQQEPDTFGAKDVQDLNWKQLMDAYSCTECGRCTDSCPANMTGKLLSPRKIMMDTRDRLEEVGEGIRKKGKDFKDDKSLLGDYIKEEEVLACTTCNACVEACPVNIDPLAIIVDLRRNMIMEESKAPNEWALMLNNIENNGAPWQFAQTDRLKWKDEE